MNCPKDQTELQQIVRKGVIIDYCPKCSGVWLDRGELDKIIERSEGITENNVNEAEATSEKESSEPSYLVGLFDINSGSVNDRASYLQSDDTK